MHLLCLVILEYCHGSPELEHAVVQGEIERMLWAEVAMTCEHGYTEQNSEGASLKIVCVAEGEESGAWQANGECKGKYFLNLFLFQNYCFEIFCTYLYKYNGAPLGNAP